MLAKKNASISFSAFIWCFTCVFLFPPVFHCGCWCPGYQLQTFCPKWNCQGFVLRLSPISSFLTHCFQLLPRFPAKHFDRFPSKNFSFDRDQIANSFFAILSLIQLDATVRLRKGDFLGIIFQHLSHCPTITLKPSWPKKLSVDDILLHPWHVIILPRQFPPSSKSNCDVL